MIMVMVRSPTADVDWKRSPRRIVYRRPWSRVAISVSHFALGVPEYPSFPVFLYGRNKSLR